MNDTKNPYEACALLTQIWSMPSTSLSMMWKLMRKNRYSVDMAIAQIKETMTASPDGVPIKQLLAQADTPEFRMWVAAKLGMM